MLVFKHPRYERVTQELAAGASNWEACKRAVMKRYRGNAKRLTGNDSIIQRLKWLNAERAAKNAVAVEAASQRLGFSRQWVMERLQAERNNAAAARQQ